MRSIAIRTWSGFVAVVALVGMQSANAEAPVSGQTSQAIRTSSGSQPDAAESSATFPPIPYDFVGLVEAGEGSFAILLRDGATTSVTQGTLLDGRFRIDAVGNKSLTATYLPTGTARTIPFAQLSQNATLNSSSALASGSNSADAGNSAGAVVAKAPLRVQIIAADRNFDPSTFTVPPGVIVNILPPTLIDLAGQRPARR